MPSFPYITTTAPVNQPVTLNHNTGPTCRIFLCIYDSTARKCFSRFKEDRFDIIDTPHSGRPSKFYEDRLNTLIHNDSFQCIQELENVTNCDHSTIVRHLHSMGKVHKSDASVQHALNQNHKNQRLVICASLLARHRLARTQHRPFLSCIVTGDRE